MLGSSCSPCCAQPAAHIGLAMSGWGPSFHCWNTCSQLRILSTDFPDNSWVEITPSGSSSAGTIQGQPPFYLPHVSNIYSGSSPRWCRTRVRFTSAAVEVELRMRQEIAISDGQMLFSARAAETTIVFQKSRASFWEDKTAPGVYVFAKPDVVSFTRESTPQWTSLSVSENDTGSFAVVLLAGSGSGPVYTKPWGFPARVQIQSVTSASGSFSQEYFFAGNNTPIDFSSAKTLCFNDSTLNVISVQAATFWSGTTTGPFIAFVFYGFASTSQNKCSQLSAEIVAGCFITPVFWEAFSANGTISIPNQGQPKNEGNNKYGPLWKFPGFGGMFSQSNSWCLTNCSNIDSIITVTKL